MALLGNRSVLHKSPLRFVNGREALLRSNFNKHGMQRNAYEAFDAKAAIPYGHLSPSAWVMPKRAGGMSSRNVTGMAMAVTGLAYGGITTTGESSMTISFADATGGLIASGNGSAAMAFTFANALLTASLGGVGAASFTISTNAAQLGALAGGDGSASMLISIANAQAYPLNDASPLRDASASFVITGALTPYAIGNMVGTTDVATDVVNANIVSVNGYSVTGNGQPGTEWGP